MNMSSIFEQENNGKNEYQIIGALESPKQIGKQIMAKMLLYLPNIDQVLKILSEQ